MGTYEFEASSHQIKSKFAPQNYQVISVSKICLSHSCQWLLLAAATVKIWIPVVYAIHDGQDLKHPLMIIKHGDMWKRDSKASKIMYNKFDVCSYFNCIKKFFGLSTYCTAIYTTIFTWISNINYIYIYMYINNK